MNHEIVHPEPQSHPDVRAAPRYWNEDAPRWSRILLGAVIVLIAALLLFWL